MYALEGFLWVCFIVSGSRQKIPPSFFSLFSSKIYLDHSNPELGAPALARPGGRSRRFFPYTSLWKYPQCQGSPTTPTLSKNWCSSPLNKPRHTAPSSPSWSPLCKTIKHKAFSACHVPGRSKKGGQEGRKRIKRKSKTQNHFQLNLPRKGGEKNTTNPCHFSYFHKTAVTYTREKYSNFSPPSPLFTAGTTLLTPVQTCAKHTVHASPLGCACIICKTEGDNDGGK